LSQWHFSRFITSKSAHCAGRPGHCATKVAETVISNDCSPA